jgi:ATP-dependent Clp protease adaptor protein ClpS
MALAKTPQLVRLKAMSPRHQTAPILEKQRAKVKPPALFNVVLLNDDYTPMEFVILILQEFFALNLEAATRVMLAVHTEGRGVCGTYPRDLAASKVNRVKEFARQHQHPLQCVMEENGT